jgi:hypothetical protein
MRNLLCNQVSRHRGFENLLIGQFLRITMAQFLIKVNASACPNQNGRPTGAEDWQRGWFDVSSSTRRYKETIPHERDFALIWVNETSRARLNGDGLIASATIQTVRPSTMPDAIQILNPILFPRPLITREVIRQYVARHSRLGVEHILVRLNNDRHRTLYHLTDDDFSELVRPIV